MFASTCMIALQKQKISAYRANHIKRIGEINLYNDYFRNKIKIELEANIKDSLISIVEKSGKESTDIIIAYLGCPEKQCATCVDTLMTLLKKGSIDDRMIIAGKFQNTNQANHVSHKTNIDLLCQILFLY